MRSLEVVVLHEQPDASLAVGEVCEHRLAQELLPQRLPEPLDLPERLWMLRPALHVCDAVTAQELFEVRLAAPRRVLPSLVGEDLARLAVLRYAALQRLEYQRRLLVMRHRPRHQVPRVIVHERRDVQSLISSQLEREDVALPQLIRLGAFETTRRLLTRRYLLAVLEQPLLVKDPPHRRLGNSKALEARHHIAEPPRSPVRVLASLRHHRRALRCRHALCLRLRHRPRRRAVDLWS